MENEVDQVSTRTETKENRQRAHFGSSLKSKTLWEWLELFVIPIFLTLVAFGIQTISSRDAKQQEVIKSYLKDMTDIIKEPKREIQEHLKKEMTSDKKWKFNHNIVQELVGSRTKLALQELEPKQRTQIMTLLSNSDLMSLIPLTQAYIEGADLQYLNMKNADLQAAHLKNANLGGAILKGTNLKYIDYDEKTNFKKATWDECTRFPKELNSEKPFSPETHGMILEQRDQEVKRKEGKECRYP